MKLSRLNDGPELFYSLQGEGASIGVPAVFMRLAGCNLSCAWCDTAYSWDGSVTPVELATDELFSLLEKFPCRHLVITGGEPLVQQKFLPELLDKLDGWYIEMETNGTIQPDEHLAERVNQFNISPKLVHAQNKKPMNVDTLRFYASQLPMKSWFKWVVASEEDLKTIEAIVREVSIEKERVILMPEASTLEALQDRRLPVAEWAIKHGFRFSDRLHVTLWGSRRGV
jgi:organic radical activating enzyme